MQLKPILAIVYIASAIWCHAMDNEPSTINLIQKLPTCLRDFGIKHPNDYSIKQLTHLLNTSITNLNRRQTEDTINKNIGFIANQMSGSYIPCSSYTVERLATEMEKLVLYKKPVPLFPYNQQLDEQNSFFFVRLLPHPFSTEFIHWNYKSSALHHYMAHCLYALCRGISPELSPENVNDPVAYAIPTKLTPIKEYILHMLNNYKYIGHKLYKEPTEQHCETLIKQFYNNKTVLEATRAINKQFNKYWQQTYKEDDLACARSALLEAHEQLHELILNPDLTRNEKFKTKESIKDFFIARLKKVPVFIRSNGKVISLRPPKFDELPPIADCNYKDIAILPPTWKNSTDILTLMPPLITLYCRRKAGTYHADAVLHNLQNFLKGETFEKGTIIYPIMSIGQDMFGIALSPQTNYALIQTFLNIVHGIAVDTQDPRLIYNEETELKNRHALVSILPTILKNIALSTQDIFYVDRIIMPLFKSSTTDSNNSKLALSAISTLVWEHNCHNGSWYVRAISPQSTVFIAQQYCHLIYKGIPVSEYPYDPHREKSYFATLIQDFPEELNAKNEDYNTYDMWNLAFIAYWLKNPENLLLEQSYFFITKHLKKVYKQNNKKMKISPEALDVLKNKFIQTFGPLTYCQHTLVHRIRTSDNALHAELTQTINNNAQTLKNSNTIELLDLNSITELLEKNLPTCSICFNLYGDQFANTNGGIHTTIKPCNHIICSTCLANVSIKLCPLCRGTIVSTETPKQSSMPPKEHPDGSII